MDVLRTTKRKYGIPTDVHERQNGEIITDVPETRSDYTYRKPARVCSSSVGQEGTALITCGGTVIQDHALRGGHTVYQLVGK
jgi:hypothetical protein